MTARDLPRTVLVLDLDPCTHPEHLDSYFGHFGEVESVAITVKPEGAYAYVRFDEEAVVMRLMLTAPHVIRRSHVRVRRACETGGRGV